MFISYHIISLALYPLAKDVTKDYLTRAILANLDYSDKRARTLLETWVKSGSTSLRKFAVSQVCYHDMMLM